jgi:hypothetical protein
MDPARYLAAAAGSLDRSVFLKLVRGQSQSPSCRLEHHHSTLLHPVCLWRARADRDHLLRLPVMDGLQHLVEALVSIRQSVSLLRRP